MRLSADSRLPQGEALRELDVALDLTRATGTSEKNRLRSVEPQQHVAMKSVRSMVGRFASTW